MWSGLQQLLLDLVCIAISASIGIEAQVDKVVISTAAGCLVVGLVFLGEFLCRFHFIAAAPWANPKLGGTGAADR